MLIKRRSSHHLTEQDVTPEAVYQDRRLILKGLGLGAATLAFPTQAGVLDLFSGDKPAPVATPAKPDRLREDGSQQLETPWQAAEVDADFPLAEPGDAVEQPQPIALQGSDLERAQVGDSVALPLPDGSTLQARVTKVELQRGGERNWQGEIRVDGDSYPVNFTVGKQATFGFIGTPQGSYSVETLGGKGWVYKNPPLDLGHGGDDALIPTHQ